MNFAVIAITILISLFTSKTTGSALAQASAYGGSGNLATLGGGLVGVIGMVLSIPATALQAGSLLGLIPSSFDSILALVTPVFAALSALGAAAIIAIDGWQKAVASGALPDLTAAQTDTLDALHKGYATLTTVEQAFGPLAKAFEAATTPLGAASKLVSRSFALIALLVVSGYFIANYVMMYYAKKAGTQYVIDARVAQVTGATT